MSTLTPNELLVQLRWRYAVKRFDAVRKVPDATWKALEEALVLSPSSYGLQPWRFVIVDDPAVRARLRTASWNQTQVTDASHYVVFAARAALSEADVAAYVCRIAEVRGVTVESLAQYQGMMVGGVVKGMDAAKRDHWAGLQTYIALGNLMTAAAAIGVDTCPMEGLDPAKYDEILGLPAQGFRTLCACAVGYRAADDKYASTAKVRFATGDVVKHV
nr:NfsB4 [uncultured bacterium]